MKAFTLDPHQYEAQNTVLISPFVTMGEFTHKGEKQVGISIGHFAPRDNQPPADKFFKVFNAKAGENLEYINVSKPDAYGMRFGSAPEDLKEATDEDIDCCFVYLKGINPAGKCRFLQSNVLREQGILIEGKIVQEPVETKNNRSASKPMYSCPAILLAQIDEAYTFQFWNDSNRTMRQVTFHYNGMELVITENKKKEYENSARPHNHGLRKPDGKWGTLGHELSHALNHRNSQPGSGNTHTKESKKARKEARRKKDQENLKRYVG